jgi:hypothetical protein
MRESKAEGLVHDRHLLLLGRKRNQVLTLDEVRRYGVDSFGDPDFLRIYDMAPQEWHERGIRVLGRTAVECTRDALGDRIGRDIARVAHRAQAARPFWVIDPFAGSCNTLYWILRHISGSGGMALETDSQVYELSRQNLAVLDMSVELRKADFCSLLTGYPLPSDRDLIWFVAPPWGTALDEAMGLDLRHTTPPIAEIVRGILDAYPHHAMIFAIQIYERTIEASLGEVMAMLDWSELCFYDFGVAGRNHGLLLGHRGLGDMHR